MEEVEPTPLEWLRSAWQEDPLEVLLPAAVGALLAQGLTAALVIRSHHNILLALCLMALGISISRSAGFFWRLSRERRDGEPLTVSPRELQLLFLPLVAAVALYGMIAPNFWLSSIFAIMSLPHLLLLAHLGKRYARLSAPEGVQEQSMIQAILIRVRLTFGYAHRLIAFYRNSRVQRGGAASPLAGLDS